MTIQQLCRENQIYKLKAIQLTKERQMLECDYNARLKDDMAAMLSELKYDLYHGLCKEIHGKEDCPCTNQTTSCLATFRVCDANSAIGKVIQQKIDSLKENKDESTR